LPIILKEQQKLKLDNTTNGKNNNTHTWLGHHHSHSTPLDNNSQNSTMAVETILSQIPKENFSAGLQTSFNVAETHHKRYSTITKL
jgi:hypothetical protein